MGCEPEDFEFESVLPTELILACSLQFESVLPTELILACSLRSLRCGIGRCRPIVVRADAP